MGFGREAYRRGIESIGAERLSDSDEEMLEKRDQLMREGLAREADKNLFWGVVVFKRGPQEEVFFSTLDEVSLWYSEVTNDLPKIDYIATWNLDMDEIDQWYRSPSYTGQLPAPPGNIVVMQPVPPSASASASDDDDDDDGPSGAMLAVGAGLVLGGLVLGSKGKKGKGRK